MAFLDDNFMDPVHSKSASKFIAAFKSYLVSVHKMGNPEKVTSELYSASICQCALSDTVNDPNPDPQARALSLGNYFRKVLNKTRPDLTQQSRDNIAWGGARYVYDNCKNFVMFDPAEVQMPFFAEALGAVIAEGTGTAAGIVATVVTKNKDAGEVARAGVTAMVASLGTSVRTRLADEWLGGVVILAPGEWPKRKARNDKKEATLDAYIQADLLTAQAAQINAETQMLMAMNQKGKVQQVILAENALAKKNATSTKSGVVLTEAEKLKALKKSEAVKTIAIAGGGAVLVALVLVVALR